MPNYKYVIVGGGMTGSAAIEGIRQTDAGGSIGLIGAEAHPPYNRPPLSKGLWKGESLESIWRKTDDGGVTRHLGRTIRHLDRPHHRVVDDQGADYGYEKLLLATGGTPRRLPFGEGKIIYFRTLDDYERLRSLAEQVLRVVVIGGGFIGSEIAAALAMQGREVTMLFPDPGIGSRAYPSDLSSFLNDYYASKGVDVRAGEQVIGARASGNGLVLSLRREGTGAESTIEADVIVAGIGIQPNVELAQEAGLVIDNGIRVDGSLRTSDPSVYAAGDVASFHNPSLDRWMRVEHEDNANTMGRLAGNAMAGAQVAYDHLPFFYSDLFDLGYEAVGDLDSRLEVVSDWKEPYREGVVYYLEAARVRGVLLWNVWGQVDAARSLIAEPGPHRAGDLKGRLPA